MIEELEKRLNSIIAKEGNLTHTLNNAKQKDLILKRRQRNIQEAQTIIQTVAKQTQELLSEQISDIVTLALNSIFETVYEFKIRYEEKRGKTEAYLYFKKDDMEIDPMNESGGGVVDVASFALRIALWYLSRPTPSNTIILDEPFKFISRDMQERAGKMLKTLSEKLGIQFIIVSHDPAIIKHADKIFETTIKDGVSKVTEKEIKEDGE